MSWSTRIQVPATAVALAWAAWSLAALAPSSVPGPEPTPQLSPQISPAGSPVPLPAAEKPAGSLEAALDELEAAWAARDADAWAGLWELEDDEARTEERQVALDHFSSSSSDLKLERPSALPPGRPIRIPVRVSSITEPRGRIEQWLLRYERRGSRFAIVAREPIGSIDGLVHLSLDPEGYRADGLKLVLEDFELSMRSGTLFTCPPSVGPTVLVFSGEGEVRFTPRPEAEKEQLRAYVGRPELVRRVSTAFVRLHPADLRRVLQPLRLEKDPEAHSRLPRARAFYDRQVTKTFVLDAPLPGAPWWVLPGLGDAAVSFEGPKGDLTFAVSTSEPESLSLFDRDKKRQICLYPGTTGTLDYSEDDGRQVDVLHHDVNARIDPALGRIEAAARLKLRLLSGGSTLRLKLDEALTVRSVESEEGGRHIFFRVRHQNGLLISLGPLSGHTGEVTLTIRYAGALNPAAIEREALQLGPVPGSPVRGSDEDLIIEPVYVYTNRTAWYPQSGDDDYATGRFRLSVPREQTALLPGIREISMEQDGRAVVEYRQDLPAKYFTAAVGRFVEVGEKETRGVLLKAVAVPRSRRPARDALEQASSIVDFFCRQFGPSPYARLTLATIEGQTPGGHSPPGLVIIQDRPLLLRGTLGEDPANFSDVPGFFLAHELAHQWWGHGVAGRNYRERWLSEGMAQYAAALWVRESRGEEAFRAVMGRMGRWSLRYTDRGPISLGHRLGHVQADPRIYRAVVYDKGAFVLHMLHRLVGEEAFRTALTSLQADRRFQKIGSGDLRAALEGASGLDLAPHFESWVNGTSVPKLEWSSHSTSGPGIWRTRVRVTATGLPGTLPATLSWMDRGKPQERTFWLEVSGANWELETARRPERLELNADWGLLAVAKTR